MVLLSEPSQLSQTYGSRRPLRADESALVQRVSRRAAVVPGAKHDDQDDVLGLVGQMLAMMQPGTRPSAENKRADTGYRPFSQSLETAMYARDADSLAAWMRWPRSSLKTL
jgi:hypothetical protein